MVLTGEDKEMRIGNSLGYHHHNNPLENLDQTHHLQQQPQQDQLIHQDQPREMQPGGGGGGAAGGGPERLFPDHHHDPAASSALHTSTLSRSNKSQAPGASAGGGGTTGGSSVGNVRTTYRECLKNHAASIGGNVTDGCGEFMPSGEEGTLEALKCAACSCHRNFHRKEKPNDGAIVVHPLHLPSAPLPSPAHSRRGHGHQAAMGGHWPPSMAAQPVKMAFGGGSTGGGGASGGTDSSSEELNFSAYQHHHHHSSGGGVPPPPPFVHQKKRFRTKFTQDQKDKMLEFAEKLGWRIPREDDTEMQRFCADVGVKRQVFKVWMHNNKNSSSSSSASKKNPPE